MNKKKRNIIVASICSLLSGIAFIASTNSLRLNLIASCISLFDIKFNPAVTASFAGTPISFAAAATNG